VYFYYFFPASPEHAPVLVHHSECTLLDRPLAFGDTVKRSFTSAESGTVISVQTEISLQQSFIESWDPQYLHPEQRITNVPESELMLVNEHNTGDFVVYKNCWMGFVDDVHDKVTIKLENESVVTVYDPYHLEIPVPTTGNGITNLKTDSFPVARPNNLMPGTRGTATNPAKTVTLPLALSPGITVTTTKENLSKGRWIFGVYDPSVSPTGIIVDVTTEYLDLTWLCQNIMVPERITPVERPPSRISCEKEAGNLRRVEKSTGGFVDIDGKPLIYGQDGELHRGGELQVGDRVRFREINAAVEKYKGAVRRIARTEMLGYDVNTFVVVGTKTRVRVQWQDLTESIDDATSLLPYLNLDEHEVWPGEIIIGKPDSTSDFPKPQPQPQPTGEGTSAAAGSKDRMDKILEAWHAVTANFVGPGAGPPTPEKVGVIQTVSPADRVASVRWFESPKVDLSGGILAPGSKTGFLETMSEDVSLYDVVAHNAFGIRRGDIVLVAPQRPPADSPPVFSQGASTPREAQATGSVGPLPPSAHAADGQLSYAVNSLRGMVDSGLLANLRALGNHSSPQYEAVSRVLDSFPSLAGEQLGHATNPAMPHTRPAVDAADVYANQPIDWVGEVVDLSVNGLVTVRLSALPEIRDVSVPIERLAVVFNGEMDFGDEDEEDYESDDDLEDDSDNEIEFVVMDEPEVLEEKIIYEGGERLDNGGEEDWLTDDEDGSGSEGMPELVSVEHSASPTETQFHPEPIPRTPPPIPANVPAPVAIHLSATPNSPPRFLVLDTPVPATHAYAFQSPLQMSPAFSRRIAREHRILSSSLPEGIFVRTWESRLDILRVLIVGPLNTPYELAPFLFDFHFPSTFPTTPPVGYFHSWTAGIGRANPNLYEDGKICLSLLGTWHAEKRGEGWSATGSSVLQLLVSLMGLVLVREPWYSMFPSPPSIPSQF
jgi:ubiquitin-conjugating enzyme E2 O